MEVRERRPGAAVGAVLGAGARVRRRRFVLLFLVASLLYAVPFWWGLAPGRDWAYDEPTPAEIVPAAFEGGGAWPLRYPPLHRHLLRPLLLVALPAATWASDTFGIELATVLQALGRAATVPFALATLALAFVLARRLGGERAGWLAALFWLGVAPQAFYAKTMNLDAPYLAWFALSLLFFVEFRRHGRRRDLVGYALAGAAAILTKDQAYGLYVLPTLAVVYWLVAERRARGEAPARAVWGALSDPRLWSAALALALAFAVVYRLWNGLEELVVHVREISGWRAMGRFQSVENSVAGHLLLAVKSGRNLLFCLGWAGAALAAAALVREAVRARSPRRAPRDRRAVELLLFPLSYYLCFISVIRYAYDRFFLPVAFVLALLVGRQLAAALARLRRPRALRLAKAAVALALGYGVARAAAVDYLMLVDQRYDVERVTAGARSVGLAGSESQLPRVDAKAPLWRYRRRACRHLDGVDYVVLQPIFVGGGFIGNRLREGLTSGRYGYRRVDLPERSVPRWLLDPRKVATNLSYLSLETWLFERDPALSCSELPN
ncbi:MAG: glycosyltransferase family 39 protein [Thermoanaerobaculia bacterium]|nr:glycosyltransferase family 39 protein [Thermoanaerobaculia bacterium]